jgi:hypothetical protein
MLIFFKLKKFKEKKIVKENIESSKNVLIYEN